MNGYPYPPGPTAPVPLTDDVFQYYFGTYRYQAGLDIDKFAGLLVQPFGSLFDFADFTPDTLGDTANPSQILHTSSFLDRATYPDFASAPFAKYQLVGKQREEPIEGSFQAYASHDDEAWKRLTLHDRRAGGLDDASTSRRAGRRAGLRLRHRRGAHRRPGQLDDAAGGGRPRRADPRVLRDRVELGAPVRRPLPDVRPGGRHVRADRSGRRRLVGPDRRLGRLGQAHYDLSAYAGSAGRGVDLVRHRLRRERDHRGRPGRRRAADQQRRLDADERLRGRRPRRLHDAGRAGGQPDLRQHLGGRRHDSTCRARSPRAW